MSPLYSLFLFLNKNNLKKSATFKKIAIDIEEEELRELVDDAKSEREEQRLFDYSSLFPENKEYLIIPDEYSDLNSGQTKEEGAQDYYGRLTEPYRNLGIEKTRPEFYESPESIKLFWRRI